MFFVGPVFDTSFRKCIRADFWEGDEDSNFSVFRGSTPVYTRTFLIEVPSVLKHLKNEIHAWKGPH